MGTQRVLTGIELAVRWETLALKSNHNILRQNAGSEVSPFTTSPHPKEGSMHTKASTYKDIFRNRRQNVTLTKRQEAMKGHFEYRKSSWVFSRNVNVH